MLIKTKHKFSLHNKIWAQTKDIENWSDESIRCKLYLTAAIAIATAAVIIALTTTNIVSQRTRSSWSTIFAIGFEYFEAHFKQIARDLDVDFDWIWNLKIEKKNWKKEKQICSVN